MVYLLILVNNIVKHLKLYYRILCSQQYTGFSLRTEVAGGFYKITGESGHSEKELTSSFHRLMKFSRKIPCAVAGGFSDLGCLMNTQNTVDLLNAAFIYV